MTSQPRTAARLLVPVLIATLVATGAYIFGLNPNPITGTHNLQWTETVVLASGERLQIERRLRYKRPCGMGGPCSEPILERNLVRSREKPAKFPDWDAPIYPILVTRDASGALWLVAATQDRDIYGRNGAPEPPYWAFRVESNAWVMTPLPEEFIGRRSNLFLAFRDDDSNESIAATLQAGSERDTGQSMHPGLRTILPSWPDTNISRQRVEPAPQLYELAKFQRK